MKNAILILIVAMSTTTLTGCAGLGVYDQSQGNFTANGYNNGLEGQTVMIGTVVSMQPAQLHNPQSKQIGRSVGMIAGGLVGSRLGGAGYGVVIHTLGALGGAVAGGLIGNEVGGRVGNGDGWIVTVRLNSGRMVAVTQDKDVPLYEGERVQVLSTFNHTRIIPFS